MWKSTDGGTTFKPKFDKQPVQSIGAIALDPTQPDNVWVGTGEAWTRNSRVDRQWHLQLHRRRRDLDQLGLPDSERIAKILVDPRDGNTVFACVTGKLWSDSRRARRLQDDRRRQDVDAGAQGREPVDRLRRLSMDAKNPDVLFASLWDFRRKGWTFRSGGDSADAPSGSGLYRSTDGGASWTELTETATGLPAKPYGRIAVAVAPSDSEHRLCVRRRRRERAVPLGRRRQDLGSPRRQPDDGVAAVLLRAT